jgi:hypothetical protein
MIDGVINGNGDSRYLKSSFTGTFDQMLAELAAGTFPIDLYGLNNDGWATLGTLLNKANLLSDATAALFLTSPTTVDEALAEAAGRCKIETGSYSGTGTFGSANSNKVILPFTPQFFFVGCSGTQYQMFCIKPATKGMNSYLGDVNNNTIVWGADYVEWYQPATGNATAQLNQNAITYNYIALG